MKKIFCEALLWDTASFFLNSPENQHILKYAFRGGLIFPLKILCIFNGLKLRTMLLFGWIFGLNLYRILYSMKLPISWKKCGGTPYRPIKFGSSNPKNFIIRRVPNMKTFHLYFQNSSCILNRFILPTVHGR